jgi:hypothetical protein
MVSGGWLVVWAEAGNAWKQSASANPAMNLRIRLRTRHPPCGARLACQKQDGSSLQSSIEQELIQIK